MAHRSSVDEASLADPSQKAGSMLDRMIEDTSDETVSRKATQAPVSEVLNAPEVVQFASGRERSRVLFITKDVSIFDEQSSLAQHFLSIQDMFDEIHIMVCVDTPKKLAQPKRMGTNIYVYMVSIAHTWSLAGPVKSFAKQQLEFTGGFRPDIIVALDPFESGEVAVILSNTYGRPLQVHITEDIFAPEFLAKDSKNKKRLKHMKQVLSGAKSVRVNTKQMQQMLAERFPSIPDIGLLPRHYDIRSILSAPQSNLLQEKYPQYKFRILFVGALDTSSQLFRAIDAARAILTSPKIGMIVLGDGPTKKEAQKRAEILGISQQVVFETQSNMLVPYLTSADILLCTDTTDKSDEVVIKAAAAGLPILAANTIMRTDLFVDGESAFLCNPEDTVAFAHKLSQFLSTNSLRKQFSQNARTIIKDRLHEDPDVYKRSYKDSIEVVFAVDKR